MSINREIAKYTIMCPYSEYYVGFKEIVVDLYVPTQIKSFFKSEFSCRIFVVIIYVKINSKTQTHRIVR